MDANGVGKDSACRIEYKNASIDRHGTRISGDVIESHSAESGFSERSGASDGVEGSRFDVVGGGIDGCGDAAGFVGAAGMKSEVSDISGEVAADNETAGAKDKVPVWKGGGRCNDDRSRINIG